MPAFGDVRDERIAENRSGQALLNRRFSGFRSSATVSLQSSGAAALRGQAKIRQLEACGGAIGDRGSLSPWYATRFLG